MAHDRPLPIGSLFTCAQPPAAPRTEILIAAPSAPALAGTTHSFALRCNVPRTTQARSARTIRLVLVTGQSIGWKKCRATNLATLRPIRDPSSCE
jgi:hypothetical protein